MDTFNIYIRFILYDGQKNDRDIIKSNTPDLISKIIFKNRNTKSKNQPPKTKVYPFFYRYLRLTTTSHVSMIDGVASTIHGDASVIHGVASTIDGFSSMIHGLSSTIHGDVSTIDGDVSTIDGLASTIHGLSSTTHGDVSMIDGDVSTIDRHILTISSLGLKTDLFLYIILNSCHIQIVKFIEKKGSLFGQRLLFLNKSC